MSGNVIVAMGITVILFSIGMLIISIIYRNTIGKRIKEELNKEYFYEDDF